MQAIKGKTSHHLLMDRRKLRESFERRGVTLSADTLAAAMGENAIESPPPSLARATVSAALSGAALSGQAASAPA